MGQSLRGVCVASGSAALRGGSGAGRECGGRRATRAGNGEEGEEESSSSSVPEKHSCPSCLGAMPRLDSSTASRGGGRAAGGG